MNKLEVLKILSEGEADINFLEKYTGVDRAIILKILKELRKQGWVAYIKGYYSLTAAGERESFQHMTAEDKLLNAVFRRKKSSE